MSDLIKAAILGVIQGITEFLPISSSGHLVLGHHILEFGEGDLMFDVTLHVATLLVVVIVFSQDLLNVLKKTCSQDSHERHEGLGIIIMVILASIPAAFVGLTFKDQFEALFSSPRAVALLLVCNGFLLILPKWFSRDSKWTLFTIGPVRTFLMGCAQAFAILPGISRSGTTITSGLLMEISPLDAARFSFFLFIPAVSGAALLQCKDAIAMGTSIAWAPLGIGFLTASISGYIAIKWLLKLLQGGQFHRFGYYCIVLGLVSYFMF